MFGKGDEYAKNSESQKSSAKDFISALHLGDFATVLDVGCGDGKIAAAIARAIPRGEVVGVDISPSMIRFANQTFSDVPNLKFFMRDAAQVNDQEKFDLIISFTVMQWVLEQAHRGLLNLEELFVFKCPQDFQKQCKEF